LYIQNIGPNTLKWEAVENCSWLEVVPISGESFRQLNEVALSVDVAGLDRGLYNCELTIMADGAVNSPKRVEVVLYVLAISLVPSQHETIQEAIDAAEDWTVVIVADGTYTGQGNRDIHFLGKAITVRSENGPDNCIIDCNGTENNPHRGFDFVNDEDTNSVLDGFSITNGYASGTWPDDCGGGIRCCDGHPTITNCIITGNIAAADGGGICCEYTDNLKISNCTISNNNAKYGGGICCYYSSPTITNCTVSNNYGKYGGGVYCGKNAPTISNCIISGNMYDGNFNGSQVHGGGGIFCYDSGMIVSNSIINGNSSNGFGGGILFDDGQQTIINSTITGNSAGSSTQAYLRPSGGGIAGCFGGHIEVLNCILWGNQAIGEPENEIFLWTITSVSTATVNYSNIEGGWLGEGNIRAVPFFVDPANGDYHLLPDSPCIDAGRNAGVYSDIEGNIRPYDFPEIDNNGELPEFDIGAYEAILPSIEIPLKFTPQALNLSSRGKFLKAHFVLPEGFSVDDVDVNTPAVIAPFAVESYKIKVMLDDEGLVRVVATFKRSDLCSSTTSYDDNIEVMVIGRLTTGQYFYGTEIIKVTDRAFEALDLLVSHWLECDCSRPDWCGGADLNSDSVVNLIDFALLNGCCFEVPEE
jgi:hypothetical protein